jgi:hypothetical protein
VALTARYMFVRFMVISGDSSQNWCLAYACLLYVIDD